MRKILIGTLMFSIMSNIMNAVMIVELDNDGDAITFDGDSVTFGGDTVIW